MSSELSPVSGFEQLRRIEASKLFQGAVIAIIILSALTIGAKTYDMPPLIEQSLSLLDNAITLFFLMEILFRFGVCQDKKRFLLDGWNLFDTLVVIGSLIPLDNSEAVLLGRLLRVFRVLRLVSVVPELRFLINSLLKAIPRMGYIVLLMFIIFYIYAAMGSMFFARVDEVLWGDVSIAMLTLFRVATFEDWTDVMYATMEHYPLSWIYYLTFIFLTAFVFLNMMIGAILEVMSEEQNAKQAQEAHDERDEIARQLKAVQEQLQILSEQMAKKPGDR
ncbi:MULTISPECIES: ion transporter [Marinobacter]|jgi:voltage-gated sodium channel|uniref:ion transporter n=1 Tax=Marinobacter TaxID=2742 RepID=UPI00200650D4|nr:MULTISPECIES: ion transporter [Marinobacter]MCK7551100.1 ion transporter [Marinobacter goseongensis]MDV3502635.1 ion transporter [Marinobacter sp. M-5]